MISIGALGATRCDVTTKLYYTVGYNFSKHTTREGEYRSLERALIGANQSLGAWHCARIIHLPTDKPVAEIWRDEGKQNHHIRIHYDALEAIVADEDTPEPAVA